MWLLGLLAICHVYRSGGGQKGRIVHGLQRSLFTIGFVVHLHLDALLPLRRLPFVQRWFIEMHGLDGSWRRSCRMLTWLLERSGSVARASVRRLNRMGERRARLG
jgi:hypothetical protein